MPEFEFEKQRSTHQQNRVGFGRPSTLPPETRKQAEKVAPPQPFLDLKIALQQFDEADPVLIHLMKNANILLKNREHRLAMNILRSILLRYPNQCEALEKMGCCQRELGHHEEALKCFRALVKERRDAHALILVAETLYLVERDRPALEAYLEALRMTVSSDQQLFEIYKNVGNIHVRAGDYDSAEEFYNKAYTLYPDSDVLLVNYGTLEIQKGCFEEALTRYRRAVELNPSNDRGWVGLAILHRQMGDFELAAANVARALDINFENRTGLRLAVDWAAQDHSLNGVIGRLKSYLVVHGEDAEMAFTLAKVFAHENRLREARLEVERVLALDPGTEGAEALREVLDREILRSGLV